MFPKRIFAILLSIVMVLNMLSAGVFAEEGDPCADGHAWDDGEVTTEPTLDAEGVRTFTCAVCGETCTESIPALEPEEEPEQEPEEEPEEEQEEEPEEELEQEPEKEPEEKSAPEEKPGIQMASAEFEAVPAVRSASLGAASGPSVYTVTLGPGEGTGVPITYSSADQSEIPTSWKDAGNCQFYYEDDGSMAFRLVMDYCPDSFTPPSGYMFDEWEGNATGFNKLSSANTTFTALWKADPDYNSASYSLSPKTYTITNSGYTDITCSFDSLVLGYVRDEFGQDVQVKNIEFYMNAGTLSDGAGHSIPFLVDNRYHFGAKERKSPGNEYSSQDETFIMAVYIAPEDYDAAVPGTYTGVFRYDAEWRPSSVPGQSGSIALTLTIEDYSVTVSVNDDTMGEASASPESGKEGTEVTLTATPSEGCRFRDWQVISGNVTITDNKFKIGTENVTIKARFLKNSSYKLEVPAVTVTPGTEWTPVNFNVTALDLQINESDRTPEDIVITLNAGQLTNTEDSSRTIPVKVASATNIYAYDQARLSFSQPGTGILRLHIDSSAWEDALPGTYNGALSYTVEYRYRNPSITVWAGSGSVAVTLTIPEASETYTVTVNNGTGGGDYAEGASVTITANEPADGQAFDKWTSEDGVTFADAAASQTTFTMPAKAVTVTATYKDIPAVTTYDITTTYCAAYLNNTVVSAATAGDEITVSPDPESFPDGKYFTGAYSSDDVTIVVNKGGDGTFTMPAKAVSVTAVFADQEDASVDLTGAAAVALPDELAGILSETGYYLEGGLDLNGDEIVDVTLDLENNTAQRVEGADSLTEDITITIPTYEGVLPSRYKSVTFKVVQSPVSTYTVTYKVVNGTWADGNTGEKTEDVESGSRPSSVPTGMIASSGYTGGTWDTDPATATITGNTIFTYTFKRGLTVKVNDQTLTYNGEVQGEGDTTYEDPAVIAEKITVEGLADEDVITSVILDGQGMEIGDYEITASSCTIGDHTDNYIITYIPGTLTIKPASYTITWLMDDGSVIDTTTVEYGKVPTHADVTKSRTAETTYTFAGWSPAIEEVKGAATYTAQFDSLSYVWASDNSSVTATYTKASDPDNPVTETVSTKSETTADCEHDGITTYTATFTKDPFTKQTKAVAEPALGHIWQQGETFLTEVNGKMMITVRFICTRNPKHIRDATAEAGEPVLDKEKENLIYTATVTTPDGDPLPVSVTVAVKGYSFVSVTNSWQKRSGKSAPFRVKRSEQDNLTVQLFLGIQVDGKTVAQKYYSKEAGSIILTLKPEFLETLSVGWHTLKAVFTDGEVSANFQVLAASSTAYPKTGDENNPMLWAAMGMLAGIAAAACGFSAKRRKRSR